LSALQLVSFFRLATENTDETSLSEPLLKRISSSPIIA
jgi:hypothetical protein